VDVLVEIFLCEGGDVELGARTSKHIFVFVFNPLSLTLSLSLLYLSLFHIVHIILICLVLFVYALTCVEKRALHSTLTLI